MLYQMLNCLCRARPVILAALLAIGSPFAYAVHDNVPPPQLFELDANTVNDSGAGLPDDWNNIHSGPNGASITTGIVPDTTPRVFTGGSKDILDISGWSHRLGSSPPKSDLLNAYAAAYPSGQDLIIYFGADRASTNGTVTTGFWFFKNEISINANGSFSGLHSDGDVLVVADYDNGGKVGTIVVYEWLGGGLQKIVQSQNLLGTPGLFCDGGDNVCATTNGSNITVPWDGTLVPGQFFEGGINITQLIPGAGCFSSFMATSRSSTSETAEIKNFILDSFPVCGMTVTKVCSDPELAGANSDMIKYKISGNVANTGFGTLYGITVTDSPALDSNSLGFFTCDADGKPTSTPANPATLGAGQKICYVASFTSNQNGGTDTVTASGTTASGGGGSAVSDTDTATCPPLQLNPDVTVDKECKSCLEPGSTPSRVVLTTSYVGSVCNKKDFPLMNVNVVDAATSAAGDTLQAVDSQGVPMPNVDLSNFTLGAATLDNNNVLVPTCQYFKGSYYPTAALLKTDLSKTTLDADNAAFTDRVTVTGKVPFASTPVTLGFKDATCNLCEPGTSCDPLTP
ncbi:hypothetical protein [Vogesella indigofera]|uniref:hypothetical protein n=1 Tax=Vogesella indigofera TaxID=45465 RepID=UPI00234D85BD|nr:hypothetical protein [Vogesella indigofera]MDC7705459.1 hypothetical protein [Vogesella indigofera]